jgi:hypothetical protein
LGEAHKQGEWSKHVSPRGLQQAGVAASGRNKNWYEYVEMELECDDKLV